MTTPALARSPHPGPGTPIVMPQWVVTRYTGPIARYADPLWPLAPLNANPSANRDNIRWNTFPAGMREEMRLIAWTLINGTLSHSFLRGRGGSWQAHTSAGKLSSTLWWWRTLARWLDERGVSAIAAITPRLLDEFARSYKDQGRSRNYVNAALTAVTRLWAFDQLSASPAGMCEPPWELEGVDDYLPAETSTGENATDPITEQTMGPLLIWAMRVVDDLADDILAAWSERQRLHATAQQQISTLQGRAALKNFFTTITAEGRPFPSTMVAGKRVCAATYIAAATGASLSQVRSTFNSPGATWGQYLSAHPGPSPLATPVVGTIGTSPWRTAIDYDEAPRLMRYLGTAAFIVCSYLTGMRPSEVLGLRTGCCPAPKAGRHLIYGHVYKTARDENGYHLSSGELRDVPWVAITPVVNAIRVLERMVPEGAFLFDQSEHDHLVRRPRDGDGALVVNTLRIRVNDFIDWANAEAIRSGRPGEVIPPDPHGQIGTGRFRRTLAWHIARRPGGLVALAIQYGHMRTSVSVGYASRSRDGIHELLDVETARATIDTVADLHADLEDGTGVSGPAARRAINAAAQAPRFEGVAITRRQARDVLANPDLAVHDNPHALLMCVYKPEKALCQREGAKDTPSLDRCVSSCSNIARTDRQASQLLMRADDLQRKAAHVPQELAKRLLASADTLRDAAERHHRDRLTLKETD